MSFITIDISGATEPKPVSPARYDLTIASVNYRQEKPDLAVTIGIDGHTDAPNVRHFISLPKKEDDEGKVAFKKLMLRRFLSQFKIPHDAAGGFDTNDFAGAQGKAQLTLSEADDSGAVYNRLQLDKMSDEPAGGNVKDNRPPKK